MKRYGSSNNLADNFGYNYYANTNKVMEVSSSVPQYGYDNNGNMTGDSLNHTYNFKYACPPSCWAAFITLIITGITFLSIKKIKNVV